MNPLNKISMSVEEIDQLFHAAMVAANRGLSYQAYVLIKTAEHFAWNHPKDAAYRWKAYAHENVSFAERWTDV